MSRRQYGHAVVDNETDDVMSRHRSAGAARKAQENYGPPSRVRYTRRKVGEKRPEPSATAEADRFTDRAMDIIFGKEKP